MHACMQAGREGGREGGWMVYITNLIVVVASIWVSPKM